MSNCKVQEEGRIVHFGCQVEEAVSRFGELLKVLRGCLRIRNRN